VTSNSLSHHIDGLMFNQSIFKNRVIEFDKDQHFSPAR